MIPTLLLNPSFMQTILGANGIIAQELSKQLVSYTKQIRQVSRNPRKVNNTDELMKADLLNYDQTEKAVAGSEVVYLLAGLKYNSKVWQEQWPKIMGNVIDACKKHNSKLVFFDNVYSYGLVKGPMTETTPFNPVSKKGEVRAQIATRLLDEVKNKNLNALIVRAADFYGPNAALGIGNVMVTDKVEANKTPQWMGSTKKIHTMTYTPDAAKTVALLGNTLTAYNQTWHALTSQEKITAEDYIRMACELGQQNYKVQTLPKLGVQLVSLFVPIMREFPEMMYQYEQDYIFDSSKFANAFNVEAISYREGIAATLR